MAVVKIDAVDVPQGSEPELERRFVTGCMESALLEFEVVRRSIAN